MKTQKCAKCSAKMKTNSAMKTHMAREHQALWTSDCPEGKTDYSSLNQVLKIKKFLVCPKCDKRIKFMSYYKMHVESCGLEGYYTCEICGHENLMLKWKSVHLQLCEKKQAEKEVSKEIEKRPVEKEEAQIVVKRKRNAAKKASKLLHNLSQDKDLLRAGSDDDASDPHRDPDEEPYVGSSDSSADVDMSDEFSDDNTDHTTIDRQSRRPYSRVNARRAGGTREMERYFPSYQKMTKYAKQKMVNELFTDIMPKKFNWTATSLSQLSWLQEALQISPQFKFTSDPTVRQLKPHEVTRQDGMPLFSAGLAVSCAAWCPVPTDQQTDQYIALACITDRDREFPVYARTVTTEVIQIWKLNIHSNTLQQTEDPQLCYIIVEEFGHVTEMEWCPSGCWSMQGTNKRDGDILPRLGLLAISCTDSTVRVFSVPKIDPVISEKGKVSGKGKGKGRRGSRGQSDPGEGATNTASSTVHVYHPEPYRTLVSQQHWESCNISCSTLTWCPVNDHRQIMAGYSDGTVRVFDLLTSSPLVCIDENLLLPSISFIAHFKVVGSCRWLGTSSTLVVTGADIDSIRFWDLCNPFVPFHIEHYTFKINRFRTALFTNGVFVGPDETCGFSENKVKYFEPANITLGLYYDRKKNTNMSIILQNGCVWDLTVSNWLNFCVSCDNCGCIMGIALPNMLNDRSEYVKSICSYRQLMLSTTLHTKGGTSKTGTSKTGTSKTGKTKPVKTKPDHKDEESHVETSKSSDVTLEQQTDASDATPIIEYKEFVKQVTTVPAKHKDEEDCAKKPLSALTSVILSPNRKTCCWMLYTGSAGLVRLVNIQGALPKACLKVIQETSTQR